MKKKPQGHSNNERYLVTYSDLITLLLAFFIILYAMSSPDAAKIESLADQLSIQFAPSTANTFELEMGSNRSVSERTKGETVTDEEAKMMDAVTENYSLDELKKKIDAEIEKEGLNSDVKTYISAEGLKIVLTDSVLFNSASAKINNSKSENLITEISHIIASISNPISIEGHTDNIPISTSEFSTNWELSTARAVTVLSTIVKGDTSIEPTRFSATGYGEYKPVASNETSEGRAANRRVEILIVRLHGDDLLTVPSEEGN